MLTEKDLQSEFNILLKLKTLINMKRIYIFKALQAAFNKLDKRNNGSIKPAEIVDVFRFSGQNPTNDEINKMVQEADEPGLISLITFDCFLSDCDF